MENYEYAKAFFESGLNEYKKEKYLDAEFYFKKSLQTKK
jgi:hypothetical protein